MVANYPNDPLRAHQLLDCLEHGWNLELRCDRGCEATWTREELFTRFPRALHATLGAVVDRARCRCGAPVEAFRVVNGGGGGFPGHATGERQLSALEAELERRGLRGLYASVLAAREAERRRRA